MADVKDYLITDLDLVEKGVSGQGRFPELKSPAMQRKFDELVLDVVRPKHNGLVYEIEGTYATKEYVANQMFEAGAGDMVAEIYDPDKDGIVSAADVAERAQNGIDEYAHRKSDGVHSLNKEGGTTNIKFLATADFAAGDTFSVNGTACTAQTSDGEPLPDGYFVAGAVVSAFQSGSILNFKSGGAALNFKVVGGTTQPESPSENTIWVNTDTAINGWVFSSDIPGPYEEGVNVIEGLTPQEGLISSTGNVSGADGTKQERYFEEYIPVSEGEVFTWDFAFPSGTTREILLSYCTYNEGKTFVSRTLLVNQVNGVSASETFTIPTGICYIRVHYRSFGETPEQTIVVQRTFQGEVPEGLVFIKTAASASVSFNALKKNEIALKPIVARQYIGGAWEAKTANVYQNGAWVVLAPWFYNNGDGCESVTGGWSLIDDGRGNNASMGTGSFTWSGNLSSNARSLFQTNQAVNVNDLNAIEFVVPTITFTSNGSGAKTRYTFALVSVKNETAPASGTLTAVAASTILTTPRQGETVSLDVSSVEGAYYIAVDVYGYYCKHTGSVTEIKGVLA